MLTKENYDKDHILLLQEKSKRDLQLLERTLPRPKSQSSRQLRLRNSRAADLYS